MSSIISDLEGISDTLKFTKIEIIAVSEESNTDEGIGVTNSGYYSKSSIFVTAKAAVDAIIPSELLEKYAWSFAGKELRWRHQSPDDNIDMLIGHIWKAWTENGELYLRFEIWGYDIRPELTAIQELVKKGDLSISVGIKKTYSVDDPEKLDAIYGRELSLTPNPACTPEMGCGTSEISETLEKKGLKMADAAIELLEKQITQNRELTEKFEKSIAKNNAILLKSNEDQENIINSLSKKITEINTGYSTIKTENTQLKEKMAEYEKKDKAREEALKTYEQRTKIVDMELIKDAKARKERLLELEGKSESELNDYIKFAERFSKFGKKVADSKDPNKRPDINNSVDNGSDETIEQNEDNKLSPKDYALKHNSALSNRINRNKYTSEKK